MDSHWLIGAMLVLAADGDAACIANDPVETARWIYANDRDFASQIVSRDSSGRINYLSPNLYGLLRADWKCRNAEEGICALSADPWLNAQDGEELPPVNFDLTGNTGTKATVQMNFHFGWRGQSDPPPVPSMARLELIRDIESTCWQLDDLIGRDGYSLKSQLERYHSEGN